MNHLHVPHPKDLIREEKQAVALFDKKLAVLMGKFLGDMRFFWFCVVLDIAELPAVISAHSTIAWITYIAQTVIQLVALPILQVYQNILQEHNDAKADSDHIALTYLANKVDEVLAEVKK